jgi:transcriptional regulator with XRE-family HTH domain
VESSDAQRAVYAAAVARAAGDKGLTQRVLADRFGMNEETFRGHMTGSVEPRRAIVFWLETELDVPKGSLSCHLGYLPTDADGLPLKSIEDAIAADTRISEDARALILASYAIALKSDR